jgi:uncharacterized protein YuzE
MKISYNKDSDTLLIELSDAPVTETQQYNEDTAIDLDSDRRILSITLARASAVTDLSSLQIESENGYYLQLDKAFISSDFDYEQ